MTRPAIEFLLTVFVAALAICIPLGAQTDGTLEGSVSDPGSGLVPDANVRITNPGIGFERLATTDRSGHFRAPGLPPGTYNVEVAHPGFQSSKRTGISLPAGSVVRVDVPLELGESRETVEVVGQPLILSTSSSDWGGSIEQQKLDRLPLNGRDLFDLAAQEPGAVVPSTTRKQITTGLGIHVSVNGARPNQNAFRMDGIYINDHSFSAPTSAAGRLLGVEGVQELRLVSSPFSVEYGRSAGAVFTAVSKSGGNDWHGSAYGFFRHSALDAKNYFDLPGEAIPPLRKQQFGGMLSGPIRSNRAFFLVNYEGVRETTSQTVRPITFSSDAREGNLPGTGGGQQITIDPLVQPYLDLYPLPNGRDFGDGTAEYINEKTTDTSEDYIAGKFDYLFRRPVRFSARYTFDDSDTSAPGPFRLWSFVSDSRYQFLHTDTQYVPSPSTIHNFRAGLSRVRNADTSRLPSDIPASLSFIEEQPLGAINIPGLTDLGGLQARLRPRVYDVTNYQFSHEATLIRGDHTVKFGGGYDRVKFDMAADLNAVGFYRFNSIEGFLTRQTRQGELMATDSTTVRSWRQNLFNAFVQDEIRLSRRLNLTLGVRYEAYSTPTEVNGRVASLRDPLNDTQVTVGSPFFDNPSATNFAPRAALAWDVTGSGRTVVRVGAGIFFDLIGTRELIIAGVRLPPFFNRLVVPGAEFPDLVQAAQNATPTNRLDGLDYFLSQPYVAQYRFAAQQQVGGSTVLEVGYAGSRGIHLPGQLGNVNPTTPEVLDDGRLYFPTGNPPLNPAFGSVGIRRTEFNSFHHAFHASVQKRWSSGFRFQTKYTWSKLIDETSTTVFTDNHVDDHVPTMFDYRSNRGLSDFDLRHVFSANLSYDLPNLKGSWKPLLGGWSLHGLVQLQSGPPFSPHVGFDRANINPSGFDLGQRPNHTGVSSEDSILGSPERFFDPLAFDLPGAGFYGNLGRNVLPGPALAVVNAAAHKVLWKNERHSVWYRVELFNVANHPNFSLPSGLHLYGRTGQRLGSAGRITATSTTSRQIQMAVRWAF